MYDRATWRRISSNIDPHKSMNKMKRKKHSGRFPITEAVSVIRSPGSRMLHCAKVQRDISTRTCTMARIPVATQPEPSVIEHFNQLQLCMFVPYDAQ